MCAHRGRVPNCGHSIRARASLAALTALLWLVTIVNLSTLASVSLAVLFLVADEINDLTDQLGESGRRVMEMEKAYKRLEMERDQVHATLEETEALVGQEQGKLQRLQVELSNAKTETERRLAEKDEEMENVRLVITYN